MPVPPKIIFARVETGFVDPKALMAIRNLELRARVVVEGFWNGLHRSPYHGFSVEFTEYRQYSPGDDTRYLDWRLFARSDRYYLKKFEDETNLRCHLLVDQSRSMSYGSRRLFQIGLRPHARRHARVVFERARRRGRAVHFCRARPRLFARAASARPFAATHARAGKRTRRQRRQTSANRCAASRNWRANAA